LGKKIVVLSCIQKGQSKKKKKITKSKVVNMAARKRLVPTSPTLRDPIVVEGNDSREDSPDARGVSEDEHEGVGKRDEEVRTLPPGVDASAM